MRDVYGNVSDKKSFAVRYPKTSLLADTEIIDWIPSDSSAVAFWDQINVSTDIAKTDARINKGFQGWMIGSKNTTWDAKSPQGPYLFKEVEGDFTMEARIADVSGLTASTRTSNEVGIKIQSATHATDYITHTVLTGWNVGNLGRSVSKNQHVEIKNGKGLQFEPYLQIQKVGEKIYLRTSRNGRDWHNLPNSPFVREDFKGQKLKVGIYQLSGNNQYGYGLVHGVKIWSYKYAE